MLLLHIGTNDDYLNSLEQFFKLNAAQFGLDAFFEELEGKKVLEQGCRYML